MNLDDLTFSATGQVIKKEKTMNNPKAFPIGMTLWDYYAAAALSSVLNASDTYDWNKCDITLLAADIADAMLAERKKRGIK